MLFSAAELQTSGGLKARVEFQEQEKQHAEREAHMVREGVPFTYEPHHYAWCAAYTHLELARRANAGDASALAQLMQEGGATFNPVTGAVAPCYAVCRVMNPRGECERHELR